MIEGGEVNKTEIFKDAVIFLYNTIFAGFFIAFTNDKGANKDCKDDRFFNWTIATAWVSFSFSGLILLKFLLRLLKVLHHVHSLFKRIEIVGGISVTVCIFGLSVVDNNDCGKLHNLSRRYYILGYVTIGFCFLVLFCAFSFFAYLDFKASKQKHQLVPPQIENPPPIIIDIPSDQAKAVEIANENQELKQ